MAKQNNATASARRTRQAGQPALDLFQLKPAVHKTIELADELGYAYREYAHYTLLDRAIADVRDGFKPVQRRIIYAMGEMSLWPTTQHRKSARVVGEVLGKYHPHGDQSVYDALARMAQDFSLRQVLVDGQGNFGSIDGDAPAAMRYTEVRLSQLGSELLRDIDMDTVNWQDNFDNSLREPTVLPAAFPNILVNGSSGIAVGFAANLPPHNLGEVCDGVTLMCERWTQRQHITVDDLLKAIPGPDFPTGGLVFRYRLDRLDGAEVRSDAIRTAYETGSAGLVCQARMDVEKGDGRSDRIVITEIPYGLQKSTIIQRIASEARESKITGVTDIVDESDRDGMRIVVQVSRQADANDVLDMLVRRSALRSTFGVNNMVLTPRHSDQGRLVEPRVLSLKEILEQFVLHRLEVIQRRSRYELARRQARLHIVQGLLIALDHIDEVIDTIRRSRTADTARENLRRKFSLSEVQATAILDMQLRRLAAMERTKLKEEEQELKERIQYLQELLESEARQLAVIRDETLDIKKKYATPRRTTIVNAAPGEGQTIITQSALDTPTQPQMIALTTAGVVRCDESAYTYRVKAGASSRAVTAHRIAVRAAPTDRVFWVSSRGRLWIGTPAQVPTEATWSSLGLSSDETVVYAGTLPAAAAEPPLYLVLGTAEGKVKRAELRPLLESLSPAAWSEMIGLNENDRVVWSGVCAETGQAVFVTRSQVLRTQVAEIGSQQTPSARGVAGIKLEEEDRVVGGAVCSDPKGRAVLLLTDKGSLKMVSLEEFPLQGRGGKGTRGLGASAAGGILVSAALCLKPTAVDVLSADGKRQRVAVNDIPLESRTGRGKKLIELAQPHEIVVWE